MKMHYTEIKQAAERYANIARLHPNQFWAVYLLSAANMINALVETSERRFVAALPMIDVEADGDNGVILKELASRSAASVNGTAPEPVQKLPAAETLPSRSKRSVIAFDGDLV